MIQQNGSRNFHFTIQQAQSNTIHRSRWNRHEMIKWLNEKIRTAFDLTMCFVWEILSAKLLHLTCVNAGKFRSTAIQLVRVVVFAANVGDVLSSWYIFFCFHAIRFPVFIELTEFYNFCFVFPFGICRTIIIVIQYKHNWSKITKILIFFTYVFGFAEPF